VAIRRWIECGTAALGLPLYTSSYPIEILLSSGFSGGTGEDGHGGLVY
jgi:hypothetical protein